MLSSLDPSSERFLVYLRQIQSANVTAQEQVSSGLRVNEASDDPDSISDILQLQTSILHTQQISTNLSRVKTETDTAELALENAVALIEDAIVIASEGATSTVTAETRSALAIEAKGILEQLVSLSQTEVEDRYVFSGDSDSTAAYVLNLDSDTGVDRQFTSDATREVELPNGSTCTVSKTAQEIFDLRNSDDTVSDENVFAAVNSLRVALENNDETAIGEALTSLRTAGGYLNQMLAYYGGYQNTIDNAIDNASELQVSLKAQLSTLRDADATAAALELDNGISFEEAALQAKSMTTHDNLFNYLG
ncbi:MAG: flagellin [Bryobacteraceae bacterium]